LEWGEASEGQSHKEREMEVGSGLFAKKGALLRLGICAGVSEFLVTPLLAGPVCLLTRDGLKSRSVSDGE